jgi:hypothetical protein
MLATRDAPNVWEISSELDADQSAKAGLARIGATSTAPTEDLLAGQLHRGDDAATA